jgi:REP element-mobilizing transposase RayT
MTDLPHSHHLRLHRDMDMPGTWLVTKSLQPKRPVLLMSSSPAVIIDALSYCVEKSTVTIGAFVVMPDHWHVVLATNTLANAMHSISTWVATKTCKQLKMHGTQWQDSYHDTRVRSSRQLKFMCAYVEQNPVRKGHCTEPNQWPWSSANPAYDHLIARPWPWDFPGDHR